LPALPSVGDGRSVTGPGRLAGAIAAIAVTLAATACGPASSPPPEGGPLRVVATSTVFADLVANVGGELVTVTSLVPRNADVHTFEPSPQDVRRVADARLIVMNGLGLDGWLTALLENAAAEGTPLVRLAEGLPGVQYIAGEHEDEVPGDDNDAAAFQPNPHLWLAVPYALLYVDRIEATLADVDPANTAVYATQAEAYRTRLRDLDARVRAEIDTIPATDRRIVTFHDALPYFAREYGLDVVGVAVEAPGQEPSAAQIAALIEAIRAAEVKAIFSESQFPPELVQRIAAETGAAVVANLYTDTLGDPPVTSYEALIEWDTARIVEALR
jgi:ABC-type Zn uptake system ZnuABC Zn-binding protein ZnuA